MSSLYSLQYLDLVHAYRLPRYGYTQQPRMGRGGIGSDLTQLLLARHRAEVQHTLLLSISNLKYFMACCGWRFYPLFVSDYFRSLNRYLCYSLYLNLDISKCLPIDHRSYLCKLSCRFSTYDKANRVHGHR